MEKALGGRTEESDSLWILREVDFTKVAETIGCFGIQVNKPSELSGALEQALADGEPAIVDVKTDIEGIAPEAWAP